MERILSNKFSRGATDPCKFLGKMLAQAGLAGASEGKSARNPVHDKGRLIAGFALEASNLINIDDEGPVEPDKRRRGKVSLERTQSLADQHGGRVRYKNACKITIGLKRAERTDSGNDGALRRAEADPIRRAVASRLGHVGSHATRELQPGNRIGKALGTDRFEKVIEGLNVESPHGMPGMRRHKKDFGRGIDLAKNLEPIGTRQLDIEKNSIRLFPLEEGQRAFSVVSLADDFKGGMIGEKFAKALAGKRFVVDDGYAKHGSPFKNIRTITMPPASTSSNRWRCG